MQGTYVIQTQPSIYQTERQYQYQPYQQYAPNINNNQVIITDQPTVNGEWSHSLFDCMDDCLDCLYAHYCRLCYSIDLGAKHNESCPTMCFCGFLALGPLRTKIRTERNIKGSICKDIMVLTCCEPCALIQMKKETLENPVVRHQPTNKSNKII